MKAFLLKFSLVILVLTGAAGIYFDAMVRQGLRELLHRQPATLYARPLELSGQSNLSWVQVQTELRWLGYRPVASTPLPGTYRQLGDQVELHLRPWQGRPATRVHLQILDGQVLLRSPAAAVILLEPLAVGSIYPGQQDERSRVPLAQLPTPLLSALVAVEDRRFYEHWGVSPRAIGRAMLVNVEAGRVVQGGSTLTQQLIKNRFLHRSRTFSRKLLELPLALLAEWHYSKEQILEAYANDVYLGQEGARAIHGFALAARHYFGRPVNELNLAEQALLVGLIKGPSYYDPWRHPERALARRRVVLEVMAEQQLISSEQASLWADAPLRLAKSRSGHNYPAYRDLVRRQLAPVDQLEAQLAHGLEIHTALDPWIQQQLEQALQRGLEKLGEPARGLEVAALVVDLRHSGVVAAVGGRDADFAGFNRVLDAIRPIGSLAKPVVYYAALAQSSRWTLATPLNDSSVVVEGRDGSRWQPSNYDRRDHGQVWLVDALAHSYNQATARLGMELGLREVVSRFGELGVRRELPVVPSLFLGAGGLSPFEVAQLYQSFALGRYQPLQAVRWAASEATHFHWSAAVQQRQVSDPAALFLTRYAMTQVVEQGTAQGVRRYLPALTIAGKTGTTDDNRDSWFAGFSGDYLTVVWLGRDDNQPHRFTGSTGALPLWGEIMAEIARQSVDLEAPLGVEWVWLGAATGLRAAPSCEGARRLPFVQGSAPTGRDACAEQAPVRRWWQWLW